MGDDRPARYEEVDADGDSRVIYRASGVGGCIRTLVAHRLGLQPSATPGWMQERYDQGTALEPKILAALAKNDSKAKPALMLRDGSQAAVVPTAHGSQVEIEYRVYGNVYVRGHVDGIGTVSCIGPTFGVKAGTVIEIKALGKTYWDSFVKNGLAGLPVTYAWQVSAYMHATGGPVLLVCARKTDAGDDFTELLGELISEPPIAVTEFKRKLVQVETTDALAEVLCDVSQYPCPFSWIAGGLCESKAQQAVVLEDGENVALEEMLVAYRELKDRVAEAGIEMRLLRDKIHTEMQQYGDKVRVAGYSVTWKEETVQEHTVATHSRAFLDIRKNRREGE